MPAAQIHSKALRANFEDFQLVADGLSRKVPPLLHRDSARWHPNGYGCNRMKPKKGRAQPTSGEMKPVKDYLLMLSLSDLRYRVKKPPCRIPSLNAVHVIVLPLQLHICVMKHHKVIFCLAWDRFLRRCSYGWGKIGRSKEAAADRLIENFAFISCCLGHASSRTFVPST